MLLGRIIVATFPSLPLNVFGKSAACPSSHALLTFTRSQCGPVRREFIAGHLEQCEFCRAELQLLNRFPEQPEQVRLTEIPPKLRALAQSVLGKSAPLGFRGA